MTMVRRLSQFDTWLAGLRDVRTKARLIVRLRNAQLGNLDDMRAVGGVWEMREHFGLGWRMYYVQRGSELIVVLEGGSKASQSRDIVTAKHFAAQLKD